MDAGEAGAFWPYLGAGDYWEGFWVKAVCWKISVFQAMHTVCKAASKVTYLSHLAIIVIAIVMDAI